MLGTEIPLPSCVRRIALTCAPNTPTVDKAGLVVEKGLPAMIVICHLPFMAKYAPPPAPRLFLPQLPNSNQAPDGLNALAKRIRLLFSKMCSLLISICRKYSTLNPEPDPLGRWVRSEELDVDEDGAPGESTGPTAGAQIAG